MGLHGDRSACSDAASLGTSGGTFRIPAFSPRRSHTREWPVCSTHRGLDSLERTTTRTPFNSLALFYEASHLTASLFLREERRRRGGKCSRTESCQCSISIAAFWGELQQVEVTLAAFLFLFFLPLSLPDWRTLGVTGHFKHIPSVLDCTASVKRAKSQRMVIRLHFSFSFSSKFA